MSISVEPVDLTTASDEILLLVHDLLVIEEAEALPDDPPRPFAERLLHMRMTRSGRKKLSWLMFEDDRAIGYAEITMGVIDNLESGDLLLVLDHHARGRGLSRVLARPAIAALGENGRSRIVIDVAADSASIPLLEAQGFTFGRQETQSRLSLEELDRVLMQSWIDSAWERAADYELLFITEPIPEEMLVPYAKLLGVMNTAPRENLDEEDETFTPEELREVEANFFRMGASLPTMVARHVGTGELAGFTNMSYSNLNPIQLWQWGTGVDPAHRNRGLGRWLKAAMIEKMIELFPEAVQVDTWNAGSNEPMLNINLAMGFRPIASYVTYQGSLDALRKWLEKSV